MARRTEKPVAWTGKIVAKLHMNRITQTELAHELGVTKQYVTMVLNGKYTPQGMEKRMDDAIESIKRKRAEE